MSRLDLSTGSVALDRLIEEMRVTPGSDMRTSLYNRGEVRATPDSDTRTSLYNRVYSRHNRS